MPGSASRRRGWAPRGAGNLPPLSWRCRDAEAGPVPASTPGSSPRSKALRSWFLSMSPKSSSRDDAATVQKATPRGAGAQSGLWPYTISGDLPIVLLHIDDVEDVAQVAQLISAHEYWRMKRLAVDPVVVNEHAASYVQDLQIAIESAVRAPVPTSRRRRPSQGTSMRSAPTS